MGYFYDIMSSILIIVIFLIVYIGLYLASIAKKIEENWPKYRCNPMIMPFANIFGEDIMRNFTFCIQGMQSDYMKYLMQPLNYNFSILGQLGQNFTLNIQVIR